MTPRDPTDSDTTDSENHNTEVEEQNPVDTPWASTPDEILDALGVQPDQGLDAGEAEQRLEEVGPNELQEKEPRSVLGILADQFKSAVIWLLAVAAVIALAFGERLEGLAILAVLAINSAIGFITEWRAIRSMEALRKLGRVETVVRRDGRVQTISATELVPGDIVLAEAGDMITADLRLIEAPRLKANESALTGESMPIGKQPGKLPADTPLMERANMLFKGTALSRGSAVGVVVGTGSNTELGHIANLVAEAEAQETPLEKRLDALGQRLVWVMLVIAAAVAVAGILAGREMLLAIEVAIALAVAAIPEGLPIVATIALARGMWRLAKANALIRRLSAVETLGATGVILADKTGTMTENRMTLTRVVLPDATVEVGGMGLDLEGSFEVEGEPAGEGLLERVDELLETVALCNNASLEAGDGGEAEVVGDPTETALLVAAAKRGIRQQSLRESKPEVRVEPFDSETKAMATYNEDGDAIRVNVKGAPETVVPMCLAARTADGEAELDDQRREELLEQAQALAADGMRTLAVATRRVSDRDAKPYEELVLLGLVGLLDPPREEVKDALARCRDAGVQVVMVTGDHLATARTIAEQLQLIEEEAPSERAVDARNLGSGDSDGIGSRALRARVIARATPQQKLALIEQHQDQGQVVAMTGDGVNDAPALKQADIGVAMGQRGTAVAKEASAMVLQDDNFATIVEAIALGRAIYANIRKFVVYLFSCNISEILVVALATLAGAPLPLLPLQILFLNLVTDVFPALALGVGQGSPSLMKRPPRDPDERILMGRHWALVGAYGAVMSAAVLGSMAIAIFALGFDAERAVTVSFCTLALAQLWHVFNMRDEARAWLRNEITGNRWIWSALVLCVALVLAAVYVPGFNTVLELSGPGAAGWGVILGMSLVPLLTGPLVRRLVSAFAPGPVNGPAGGPATSGR